MRQSTQTLAQNQAPPGIKWKKSKLASNDDESQKNQNKIAPQYGDADPYRRCWRQPSRTNPLTSPHNLPGPEAGGLLLALSCRVPSLTPDLPPPSINPPKENRRRPASATSHNRTACVRESSCMLRSPSRSILSFRPLLSTSEKRLLYRAEPHCKEPRNRPAYARQSEGLSRALSRSTLALRRDLPSNTAIRLICYRGCSDHAELEDCPAPVRQSS